MGVKKPVFDHPSLKIGERVYSDLQPGQRMPILNWVVAAKPVLWTAFCKLWVFKTWRQYFRYSYFFEEKLDPTKRYILYEAPHGTFPIGPIVAGTLCQTFFPDAPIYSVAANSVFNIFISWIGSLPASKSNFKRLLAHGSVAVVVGGIAEMCNPKKERIKMLGRKGFVRIALEEQVDGIVPVYYFGNSQAFNFGPAFLEGVHGKPIPVPKVAKDDPEFERHVSELLDIAVKGMQDLYEKHRKEYGWPEKPLSIE
ncbi:uncharacterized protein HaLaN_10943, partial [Haematococcus lacustris]